MGECCSRKLKQALLSILLHAALDCCASRWWCRVHSEVLLAFMLAMVQGCGVVEFETPEQAHRAIQMFNGQQVSCFISGPHANEHHAEET